MARARLQLRGRIQGVGFRHHLRRLADDFGIRGRAENQADGSVEVIAEGARSAIEAFVEHCRRGTPFARVEDVTMSWEDDKDEYQTFVIR